MLNEILEIRSMNYGSHKDSDNVLSHWWQIAERKWLLVFGIILYKQRNLKLTWLLHRKKKLEWYEKHVCFSKRGRKTK
jgi:hypothetical protein